MQREQLLNSLSRYFKGVNGWQTLVMALQILDNNRKLDGYGINKARQRLGIVILLLLSAVTAPLVLRDRRGFLISAHLQNLCEWYI